MLPSIAIVDYGMGNLHSIYKTIYRLNANPRVVSDASQIVNADKIILPGVGHFKKAIQNLKQLGIYDALNEAAIVKRTPILGICLGMQLMAKQSEEGNVDGLGWIDANVVKFSIRDKLQYKVPQIGWNTIKICKESMLYKNIDDKSEFYFLHSYHLVVKNKNDILSHTDFEYEFVSAIQKENIFGTQFHPEKSHQPGALLFKNFIQL